MGNSSQWLFQAGTITMLIVAEHKNLDKLFVSMYHTM